MRRHVGMIEMTNVSRRERRSLSRSESVSSEGERALSRTEVEPSRSEGSLARPGMVLFRRCKRNPDRQKRESDWGGSETEKLSDWSDVSLSQRDQGRSNHTGVPGISDWGISGEVRSVESMRVSMREVCDG